MSELNLVTVPNLFIAPDKIPLVGRKVVGITGPQSKTSMEHGYRITGIESEETYYPFGHTAERIAEFFSRTRALAPEKRPDYDCHRFVWFAHEKTDELRVSDILRIRDQIPANPDSLIPGQPYAVETDEGILNHSLLGVDNSRQNLSVLGANEPLAITESHDLQEFYKGVAINHIIPIAVE